MRLPAFVVIAGILCSLVGCGGAEKPAGTPVKVTGKVLLMGEPLKDHTLIFSTTSEKVPKDFRNYSAELAADGTYTIEKVYPGKYTVFFSVKQAPMTDPGMAMADPAAGSPIGAFLSPSSPLVADVTESSTAPFNFDLQPMAAMGTY